MQVQSSVPFFDQFSPLEIRFQHRLFYDIKKKFDYSTGTQCVLFSGAVGSGKSVMAAHLIWSHALNNPGADIGIGRRDLKRLKSTLLKTILLHRPSNWRINEDFQFNKAESKITLPNSSTISSFSWADGDLERFKSEQFSMFVIEEASENDNQEIFSAILSRLGRLTHIKEKLFLLLTNPDEPDHWINKDFIMKAGNIDSKIREGDYNSNYHVYYSLTVQNKFLDKAYVQMLLKSNHSKWIERNLEGKWISFGGQGLYFAYNEEKHLVNRDYIVDLKHPIYVSFDFNVAKGKPMSVCLSQYINDTFHFFDECVVEGANTSKILDEMHSKHMFNYNTQYIINGDAAGWSKGSATNGYSDYDIIKNFLNKINPNGKFNFKIDVDLSNPEVKVRHNTVNAYLQNGLGEARIFVYKRCKTLNEGFKLTQLKDNARYIEDDSKYYQHITTAAGYTICKNSGKKAQAKVLRF